MNNISINTDKLYGFLKKKGINDYKETIKEANKSLHEKTGLGNDFIGWLNLPSSISEKEITEIKETADDLRRKVDVIVIVGIGGSYLGARAVIDALSNNFDALKEKRENPIILYAGHNISEDYLYELNEYLDSTSFGLIVISKSGTTTEPAIAFRVLKKTLENKYGRFDAQARIIAITDSKKGALKELAEKESYKTFVIPDDVGGRYSVLTPVGLLPIACAGFDIEKLINGAKEMEEQTAPEVNFEDNIAAQYAAARNALYNEKKLIEILVNYHPKLQYFIEWWKQLYGESEGKKKKGIFPAGVNFTTDLHSMGQYIQDGQRNLFETVISIENTKHQLEIPSDEDNLDKLNYIAGKNIDEVNKQAELGTTIAHVDGGVPNIKISVPKLNEYYLGQLIYFFEKACALSGYVLKINPFDQPGVEEYKSNMFALLKKPGFEEQTKEIYQRIEE